MSKSYEASLPHVIGIRLRHELKLELGLRTIDVILLERILAAEAARDLKIENSKTPSEDFGTTAAEPAKADVG